MSQKYIAMKRNFAQAVQDGKIKEGTEEYYEMQNEIDQVAISLKEAQNKVVEFQASIRDLKWEQFDQLQDAIGRITSESDFLIDLMSHKDMYDKDGKMTEQGLATMGLHGVNYNTYMAQADKYKEEMLKISAELANDPKITRINKGSKYPYAIDATDGTELGWVKLNQLKGYASGIMRVPNDQLAWTQEQGEEAIVRNDGSILTPLSRDVSVLNADMTKNLWDFMGNPGSFLSDYSDGFVNSEKYSTKNEESNVNIASVFDNVTFNLPNVIDSQAFVRELVTNKKAERAIQAMTIDRIRGGSSLAKYKYKH